MELSLLLKIFLVLYLSKCNAVDINYISMDNENEEQQEIEYFDTDSRRTMKTSPKHTQELNANTTATLAQTDNYDDDNYEDTDFKIISIRLPESEKKRHKTTTNQTLQPPNITSTTSTTAKSRKPTTIVSLYTDFQYDLDVVDEDEESLLRERPEIPENITKNNTTQLKFEFDFKFNSSVTQNETNQNIYSQFYNLEPAALLFDFRNPAKGNKNVNAWYVPENRPCWDLPLLYGEMGKSYSADHVFVISPAKLKKVMEQHEEKPPGQKASQSGRNLDRWCGVSPCYGDHTLCLFSNNQNAHICGVNYKVNVPNMVEQVALVNTLNSMRNHVAKGSQEQYPRLPPAANMQQVIYDYDLEGMAAAWLRQCLPGPAPCSALDAAFVSELECTKFAERCCSKATSPGSCTPKQECFIEPIIGCLHTWFWSAKNRITDTDVKCGHVTSHSYSTVQLIWAKTNKIGCAYATRDNGDIRVVCNFAPGAPFKLRTKFFCGILAHSDVTEMTQYRYRNLMDRQTQLLMGIDLDLDINIPVYVKNHTKKWSPQTSPPSSESWGVISLRKEYRSEWVRQTARAYRNGTKGVIARLVTRYRFSEETQARCDQEEPMYEVGAPGELCAETGRKFYALCYDFRDPSPRYRLVAVLAPLALFSLILYDLFSGVMRQTNY